MPNQSLNIDLHVIRLPVTEPGENGCPPIGSSGDPLAGAESLLKLLNGALATELVCVLRYRHHHFLALANHSQTAAKEFLEHANEELGHADLLAERIVQLGGAPDFSPKTLLQHSQPESVEVSSMAGMIRDVLIAGGLAIDNYRGMVQFLGNSDPITRRMLEGILAVEEEHADELSELLVSRFHASAQARGARQQPNPVVGVVLQIG